MEGNQRFFRCIGHSISVFIAIFIVCDAAADAAAAAARFGLLGNFLFLFRREFMNSTWSIGAGGALEPPPARPFFFSFGRASRTFAPFLPILNPFAMYVHVRVEPSEGTGKEREERRKERKKGRFASLGLRACVISALCTINNRHRRHTS